MNRKVLQKIEILPAIISEIRNAQVEILIVSAWFSDENLFDVLVKKQKQGVKVKLIVKDYLKNEKIKFSELSKAGGEIYMIEKETYGMMEKKYCIIDEKKVILAMFNWSANIIVSSHESIIITDQNTTIQNAKANFYQMKNVATRIEKNELYKSFFVKVKEKIIRCIGRKGKESQNKINELGKEKNIELEKEGKFKMIKSSDSLEDEINIFFHNRN
jgi:phosphatidylserine/phosphatidylglycerophosphate/cardiolipin synthase-like enzyme